LIYLGEHDKVPHVMHQRKKVEAAVARLNLQSQLLSVKVTGLKVFGGGHVTVLTLDDEIIKSYRTFIDRELARDGIRSASEYAFNPHVTINKHEKRATPLLPTWMNQIPERVYLDKPELWWASLTGDQ
jgi:2'-5' RNA ligase